MKNVTIALPDEVYRQARIQAAQSGTSVSAMVRDYLNSLSSAEREFRAREREQTETLARLGAFSASDRLSREELHERAVR